MIKISNPAGGAWTTSGNLITARQQHASAGTQSAALAFGGQDASLATISSSEKFNGSTWTISGNLSAVKYSLAGAGTQSAALAFGGVGGGYYQSVTEKFNGSTWTTSGNLSGVKYNLAGAGTQSAALAFGGNNNSVIAVTEKFNGSTWTTSGSLSAAKETLAGAGTQNAGLAFGGVGVAFYNVTEKFNGSTWTTSGSLTIARSRLAGTGTQNAGLAFGGITSTNSSLNITEKFNGSAWSTFGNLSIAKSRLSGAGIQGAGLAIGGYTSATVVTPVTEKFAGGDPEPIYLTETIVTNPTMGTLFSDEVGMSYSLVAGTGDTDNASFFISNNHLNTSLSSFDYETKPSYSVRIQASNGTTTYQNVVTIEILNNMIDDPVTVTLSNPASGTWSVVGASTLTARKYLAGAGTENAALAIGGDSYLTKTEKFDGSAWSATGNLNFNRKTFAATGLQTAALAFGGAYSAVTEKFNGSTWTTSGNLIGTITDLAGTGTQDAALAFGGGSGQKGTQKFNGSTWSITGDMITGKYQLAGAGTQNAGLAFGGTDSFGQRSLTTEKFNGSTWAASGNLSVARTALVGSGLQTAALAIGGLVPSYSALTEKFNGSTWTTNTSMSGGRSYFGNAKNAQSAALVFGGFNGFNDLATTQKFIDGGNVSPLQINEGVLSSPTLCKFSTSEAGMSYSLVAGTGDTDNTSFSISNNNLNTSLSSFNYTNKSSYSVRVQASNGTTTYQNVVTINVIDVPDNLAPTDIILSSNSIAENNAVNAVVGTLSAIDPNVGDTSFTFSITGGADAAKFNISGNQLRASQAFNYESPADANADNVYVVEITAQDAGGLSYAKTFNISVTNDASDDSIAAPNVAIIYIQSIGRYKFNLNTDPRTIPVLMAGSALPTNSVIRHTGNNKKYVKLEGAATAFGEIPVTPPASWNFSEEGISAWAVLQGF